MSVKHLASVLEADIGDPIAKLVLIGIANHCDEYGKAWPSQGVLGQYAGCSRQTVSKKIAWLEGRGLIQRETRNSPAKGQETCVYTLSSTLTPPVKHVDTPCKAEATPPVKPGVYTNHHITIKNITPPIVPPKDAIEVWNEVCGDVLPKVQKMHDSRKRTLAKRLAEDFDNSLDRWREYCEQIRASGFMTGENDRGWRADFDWALNPKNLAKVIEGKFGSSPKPKPPDPDAPLLRIAPLWQRIFEKSGKGYTPKPERHEVSRAFTLGVISEGCAKANGLEVQ